jgi:hypothetical protein
VRKVTFWDADEIATFAFGFATRRCMRKFEGFSTERTTKTD